MVDSDLFRQINVFPLQSLGAFGIADTLCWKTAKLTMTCCLFVLVEGVVYGKRWRHQTAKQRHQTEPG